MTAVRSTGARVEELLDVLRSGRVSGPAAAQAAEELTGLLVGLYGAGLAAIVGVLREQGEAGAAILARLADDPAVEGLLLLHDLHPLGTDARIQRALDRVRPYLGSHAGGVRYLGAEGGVARLRLEGSCHGCPSSAVTVELALRSAVEDAAPEVTEVAVEGMTPAPGPALLQIGPRPSDAGSPGARAGGGSPGGASSGHAGPAGPGPGDAGRPGSMAAGATWITLPGIGAPSSRPVTATAGATSVLVCAVRGTLYAYRDACAACGSSLAAGTLNREELTCPACAARYNVRLAGAGLTDPARHLDPLPLLADSQGVRVALPEIPLPAAAPEAARS
jgi:Fe-S cluster biogenesis protein NfuA/nitrite reductase/ring-hydroxylating ferredoxin subunit